LHVKKTGWLLPEQAYPRVMRPAGFQATPVVPNPEMGIALDALHKIAPTTAGRVSRLDMAPNTETIRNLIDSNIPIERYKNTNLLGQWNRDSGNMYVNPRSEASNIAGTAQTLGHEVAHSVGIPEGREMHNVEGLIKMMMDIQGMKEGLDFSPEGGWYEKGRYRAR
jgi:hypothetical protein